MFSIRLHRARKAAGLSLRDLGERVGVSHAAIKKYEDGIAMPSSDILIGLSRTFRSREPVKQPTHAAPADESWAQAKARVRVWPYGYHSCVVDSPKTPCSC